MINQENYIEYLLMYIDGELNAEQSIAVEKYVQQNEYASQELQLLTSTKLNYHKISFGNLNSLIKDENKAINQQNYHEKFLHYIDGELTIDENREIERYVLQNPQLQQEFSLLKQTKVVAPTINYPKKSELFKTNKTLLFSWKKVAVAACLFLLTTTLWLIFTKQTSKSERILVTANNEINNETKRILKNNLSNESIKSESNQITANINSPNKLFNNRPSSIKSRESQIINLTNNSTKINTNHLLISDNTNTSRTAIETNEFKNTSNLLALSTETNQGNVLIDANSNHQTINATTKANNDVTEKINTSNTIVYKTLNDDDNDNEINELSNKPTKKSSLKNLISKASTLINHESENENSKKFFSITLR